MGKTGHLTENELKEIINGKKVDNFVETGTYLADSTLEAAKLFNTVYTMEIVPELHEKAKARCADVDNIHLLLGDTVQLLPTVAKQISAEESGCLWFLDAHQSGPETGNNGKWVPLLNELDVILGSIQGDKCDYIFVIDDVRLFSAYWDWAEVSLQSIEERFKQYNINIKSKMLMNDRFILYI